MQTGESDIYRPTDAAVHATYEYARALRRRGRGIGNVVVVGGEKEEVSADGEVEGKPQQTKQVRKV